MTRFSMSSICGATLLLMLGASYAARAQSDAQAPLAQALSVQATATLLAGKSTGSPETIEIEKSAEWQRAAQNNSAQRLWDAQGPGLAASSVPDQTQREQISAAARLKGSAYENIETLLYPFNGPDVILPQLFFPKLKKLILIGFEAPDALPPIENESMAQLTAHISDVARSYETHSRAKSGVSNVTALCVGLVVQGFEITGLRYITLNAQGTAIEDFRGINSGLQISYQLPGESEMRSIYYFRTNRFKQEMGPRFKNFLDQAGIDMVFYKKSSISESEFNRFFRVNRLTDMARHRIDADLE